MNPDETAMTCEQMARSEDAEVDVEVLRDIPKQFSVEDERSANWLIQKIVTARAYADRVSAWAEQEKRRAEREEHTLTFLYGRQLEAWTKMEITRCGGRRKSISLPAGSVGFRTVAPRLVVDSEQAVLAWARDRCPQAIVVVERLSKSQLDEHARATGEIPDSGVHLDRGGQRFYLK